jgi:hypothetical protein
MGNVALLYRNSDECVALDLQQQKARRQSAIRECHIFRCGAAELGNVS